MSLSYFTPSISLSSLPAAALIRDSDAVVAVKCLNNFNNTLSSEVLHANHNQEYTFALNHPHWALATVYNAWRGRCLVA